MSVLATGALPRLKRGPCRRQDQAGKGHKVAGFGRWPGYSVGSIPGLCASPSEVTLLEKTLDTVSVRHAHRPGRPRKRPDRLVLDRGYDSNHLREQLVKRGIEPIIPARSNNRQATHQDGRKMRRYKHRWIVEPAPRSLAERTFAWLGCFRRLVVRYDRSILVYSGFFHLACAMLTLRRVLK